MSSEYMVGDMDFDVLTEIGNIGAGNAVTALSQMLNAKIDMIVPMVEMLSFPELSEIIGGAETLVAGILLSLDGDIEGTMLFALEGNDAHLLVSQLMGTDHRTGDFDEMEKSALMELGNIITGAYLSAISRLTKLTIIPSVPSLCVDMAGAILSVPAIEFGQLGDEAMLIESKFNNLDTHISGYFILIPTIESYEKILKSLGIR